MRSPNHSLPALIFLIILIACGSSTEPDNAQLYSRQPTPSPFPQLIGRVNDFEEILSPEQEQILSDLLEEFEQQTTDQIVIVTMESLRGYDTIEEYALDLANYWGIGQDEADNGVLILLWAGLRKIRIENGYGIKKRLTDEETKQIIDQQMIPEFKEGRYFEGLKQALGAIFHQLQPQ